MKSFDNLNKFTCLFKKQKTKMLRKETDYEKNINFRQPKKK